MIVLHLSYREVQAQNIPSFIICLAQKVVVVSVQIPAGLFLCGVWSFLVQSHKSCISWFVLSQIV